MSEIPGYTLEDFLEWDFNRVATPELIKKYEPYREAVELWLDGFDEDTMSWRDYAPSCPI